MSSSSSSSSSLLISTCRLAELQLTDHETSAHLFSRLDAEGKDILHLNLFVDEDAFEGSYDVAASSLRPIADAFGLSPDAVKKMTLEALRIGANSQFLYDLRRKVDEEAEATLIWRLESEGFGVSQKIGSASLKRLSRNDAARSIHAAFSNASRTIDDAVEEKARLEAEAARFESDRRRAVDKYRKAVEESKGKEEEMLGKFVRILNEKKAEIRRLKRKLEAATAAGRDAVEEEEEEEDGREATGSDQPAMETQDQIYGEDTDVDSDSSDRGGPSSKDEDSATSSKRLRTGATSAPANCSAGNPRGSCRSTDAVTKSHSFVHNFLQDSSDDED